MEERDVVGLDVSAARFGEIRHSHGSGWPETHPPGAQLGRRALLKPPPHLDKLRQAELFRAKSGFRPAFDYILTIHHGEIVA